MAYVREKKVRNKKTGKTYVYRQLVEGVWEGGKVRQKVLAHLGKHPTLEAALEAIRKDDGRINAELRETERRQEETRVALVERWGDALEQYPDSAKAKYIGLPEPRDVVRRAYRREGGQAKRYREAFDMPEVDAIPDNPRLKDFGPLVSALEAYWADHERILDLHESRKANGASYDNLQGYEEDRARGTSPKEGRVWRKLMAMPRPDADDTTDI